METKSDARMLRERLDKIGVIAAGNPPARPDDADMAYFAYLDLSEGLWDSKLQLETLWHNMEIAGLAEGLSTALTKNKDSIIFPVGEDLTAELSDHRLILKETGGVRIEVSTESYVRAGEHSYRDKFLRKLQNQIYPMERSLPQLEEWFARTRTVWQGACADFYAQADVILDRKLQENELDQSENIER
jgi:hypothetical protein